MIERKSQAEIEVMRAAGKIVAAVHALCREMARPGVSTGELDEAAEELIRSRGAIPTFKGYRGFPATLCTSVDDEVVHGIPSRKRVLVDGQILSLDCGATLDGLVADAATTIPIGVVGDDVLKLLRVCEESLWKGIEAACVGNRVNDIGFAVESHVKRYGYGIVRDYGGHGVGYRLHEEPHIPNHGRSNTGPRIKAGYCLAIEPMINLGGDDVKVLPDNWTVVTADGKSSAHFEHSLAVTNDGPLVLSLPDGAPQPFLGGKII
jgi:methionyl aminopeptidase